MALSDVGESSPDSAPKRVENRPRKRSRLRWILSGVALFLLLSLVILNGPGFRAIGKYAAGRYLGTMGLKGDLKIAGSITGGFTISEVKFEQVSADAGPSDPKLPTIHQIELNRARVDYRFLDLLTSAASVTWLDLVELNGLSVDLTLPDPESAKSDDPSPKGIPQHRDDFNPLWGALAADINISDINLIIRESSGKQTIVEGFALVLPWGEAGEIGFDSLTIPGRPKNKGVRIPFTREEHQLVLGPVPVTDSIEVRTIEIAEPRPTVFTAATEVFVGGGTITLRLEESGNVALSLRERNMIDLATLSEELPLKGRVTDLEFTFQNPFATPNQWQLDGKLIASGLQYENAGIDSLALLIQDNALSLDIRRPDLTLNATATAPLSQIADTGQLPDLPVDLSLRADINNLTTLAASFAPDIPLKGQVNLETKNVQIDLQGNTRSGTLLLEGENFSWNGLSLEVLQLAANIREPNKIQLAADLGIDRANSLRLTGTFDQRQLTYNAEASVGISPSYKLRDWLARNEAPLVAGNANLRLKAEGNLNPDTSSHKGSIDLTLDDITIDDGTTFHGSVTGSFEDTSAAIQALRLHTNEWKLAGTANWDSKTITLNDWKLNETGKEHLPLSLSASLPFDPASGTAFLEQDAPIDLALKLDRLNIAQLMALTTSEPPLDGVLSGSLTGTGKFGDLKLQSQLAFYPELAQVGEDSQLNLDLDFAGAFMVPSSWDTTLKASLLGLEWNELTFGSINLAAFTEEVRGGKQLSGGLTFEHGGSSLNAKTSIQLDGADDFEALAERDIDASAALHIPDLAALWRDFAPENLREFPVEGALRLACTDIQMKRGELLRGRVELSEASLKLSGEPFSALALEAAVTEPNGIVSKLSVSADDKSQLSLDAFYSLNRQAYDGDLELTLDLEKDGVLKRLLGERNIASLLPGHTIVSGNAKGDLSGGETSGSIKADLKRLHLASGAAPISANISADFTQATLTSSFSVSSDPLNLNGALDWDGTRVSLSQLEAVADGKTVLTGSGAVPLEAGKLDAQSWLQSSSPLDLSLSSKDLRLSTIFKLVAEEAPVLGTLNLDLKASGQAATPSIRLDTSLTDITVPGKKAIEVGRLDLNLATADEKATLEGSFKHPQINPFTLKAAVPFRPTQWIDGSVKIADEPVSLSAHMDRSSLAFLASQLPGIQAIDGTLGLDAKVGGTISKPTVSGNGSLDVTQLRLDDRNLPSFYDINLATRFSENKVTIDRLYAIVAGGEVSGNGEFSFGADREPAIDFRLKGNDVLMARSPDLSLRSNLDISLIGPWSEARLSGDIGITNSRFFKNFDLLPTALPRRNSSALPTVERSPTGGGAAYTDLDFGVPIEPFNAWPVDIRLHTIDPFQVRSNLVESDLAADIQVKGTLGKPYPLGYLELAEGALFLPFSSIDVEIGRVQFDQNTGFNGALELRARAKADSYRINIFLFNRILSPQYVLTSVPPLPSEDLLTLLITGTTRDELLSGDAGSLAAGKAATLLFKNMRKVSASADREPTIIDELQDRTELEIGGVNPETGEHTIAGKVRLWKQLFFVGDVDAQSDYRATLKYIFRFR
ncbi:MAG: translocation/assembly module TamB domain-containing protein [Verrucomicrobiales bacterium]|nr:translocation/assembly module TamB domain-containing protein [Verrucomicrobiales bacterium]